MLRPLAMKEKISFEYRNISLGILEKSSNGYVYNSNIPNEQKVRESKVFPQSDYSLWNSFQKTSKELFQDIQDVLESFSREDIAQRAGIKNQDSTWEKLVKISKLKTLTPNFYLKELKEQQEE